MLCWVASQWVSLAHKLQRLALSPHSKTFLGSNPPGGRNFFAWSLHFLPVSVWVLFRSLGGEDYGKLTLDVNVSV